MFMEEQSKLNFRQRLLNKSKIELSIQEHTRLMDDAWKTFQVSGL